MRRTRHRWLIGGLLGLALAAALAFGQPSPYTGTLLDRPAVAGDPGSQSGGGG